MGLLVGQRAVIRRDVPLHLMGSAGAVQAVALASFDCLLQRNFARHGQHHIGRRVEPLGAVVEHLRGQAGNAFHRAGNVVPQGVVGVQAVEQRVEQPPIGAVIVHLDLLPDDALLFGDGGLGEPGLAHHT